MKIFRIISIYLFITLFFQSNLFSQEINFSIDAYKQFLSTHQNMNTDDLLKMHPAGLFEKKLNYDYQNAEYFDSIDTKYNLTYYEKSLLQKNGFMVSQRLSEMSFGSSLLKIFHNDLPVFISTDAILHAYHTSYDRILRDVELAILINDVKSILTQLHGKIYQLDSKYASNKSMLKMLKDVDIYLTVPLKLLGENTSPYYSSNASKIDTILQMIYDEKGMVKYPLFSDAAVYYDWSQFKPRGHYVDDSKPILEKYFRAMMWLGRVEIYLLSPIADTVGINKQSFEDIQRQTIDAFLMLELYNLSPDAVEKYNEVESILKFFVGESDNVTIKNLLVLGSLTNIHGASELLNSSKLIAFQDSLKNQTYARQKIVSQILFNAQTTEIDSIVPASAFLLFGQRFVIDSYVTSSVVFDRIKYNGQNVCRLSPSTLDIMFSLGNDAAAQLLKNELDNYHYSSNLASLRYLINSYTNDFWKSSLYNGWLNSLRFLNPPKDRSNLPRFMRTAAFWQEKLNTQLASWTQLRHDNLLYAKQSYTGATVCSFPHTYIEPFPEFFNWLKTISNQARIEFNNINFDVKNLYVKSLIQNYFDNFSSTMDTLYQITQKELDGTSFDSAEISFLKRVVYNQESGSGTMPYAGWYPKLFYADEMNQSKGFLTGDYLVADIHTIPTDCNGTPVGWVKHVGTGDVNLAVLTTKMADGNDVAFIGPVMSYHEYTTTNFQRLTDQEWEDTYLKTSTRPDWVNIYLADENGQTRGIGAELLTSVKKDDAGESLPVNHLIAKNYPNPFNPSTIITFSIPNNLSNSFTKLEVYDLKGQIIKRLLSRELPAGNYFTKWNGKNEFGKSVASGIYIFNLKVGNKQVSGKMNLIK